VVDSLRPLVVQRVTLPLERIECSEQGLKA
jgi:hypothetical protein